MTQAQAQAVQAQARAMAPGQGQAQGRPQAQALQATAAVPLIDGLRLEMLEALQGCDTPAYLSCILPRLAEEAAQHGNSLKGMDELDSKDGRIGMLLNHAQPEVLTSVIRGTLAADSKDGLFDLATMHRDAGMPGTYAHSLRIAGRAGRWLTALELKRVCARMERYIQASKQYYLARQRWTSPALHAQDVKGIDNAITLTSDTRPRWAQEEAGVKRLEALKDALTRLADASLVFDPTGMTELRQGPLYVGCSSLTIKERVMQHVDWRKAPPGLNKLLGMLISCILEEKLDPRVEPVAVLPVYCTKDLRLSEILVCGLAQSMYVMGGLNVQCPGGNTKPVPDQYAKDALKLLANCGEVRERLKRTITQCDAHIQDGHNRQQLAKTQADMDAVKEGYQALVDANEKCKDRRKRVDAAVETAREKERQLQTSIEEWHQATANVRKVEGLLKSKRVVDMLKAAAEKRG
ncbi:hypothetical protein MAPG_04876 [Magnaporthiopsis poae ATCC 64411]|uniref:Uncharacterized protein n=1 Tax=Magnaporthiopsis poae (strain ATCC 64411 / 73-15) TaxID=644358 RepID=A0A0C4DXW9_MAGP6|nr:hypothetical protein MAPG_04876 [Magnaporthiopsis poae ATCC 64411]